MTNDELDELAHHIFQRSSRRLYLFHKYGDTIFDWETFDIIRYRPMPCTPAGDVVGTVDRRMALHKAIKYADDLMNHLSDYTECQMAKDLIKAAARGPRL